MKILTHILYNSEINTGNARFHAQFQFDLHSFDQNILSFENSILNHKKRIKKKLNFSLFLFHFLHSEFILFTGK